MRKLTLLILVLLLGAVLLAACGGQATPAPAGGSSAPKVEGEALTVEKCSECHSFERVSAVKENLAGWKEIVRSMENRGLKITEDEFKLITEYLAKTYPR